MTEMITLTIDGQTVSVTEGTTLLKAAEGVGKKIPAICYHDCCTANGLCRLCVVEVEGSRTLLPSCVTKAQAGQQVHTNSERVTRSRRTILEMLAATVDLSDAPEIQAYLDEYQADPERFPGARRRQVPLFDDNPMYVRDYSQCVLCWRCVQVCAEDAQYTYALNFSGRGFDTQIATFYDVPMPESTCVFCGQCVGVCPTGALKARREWMLEQAYSPQEIVQAGMLEQKKRRQR
jgi:NADH dehydrogenase/NADH:ubiquinone oxidoreductase subunit G